MKDREIVLKKQKMQPLPLGTIKPTGWLYNQLRIQADGLSGHLDEFWPDVKNSGWFGGDAEGWERAPYWLDGVVPLAYLLEDERLIAKIQGYMDYIITHQDESGWIGPDTDHSQYDLWAIFLAFKPLIQYYEATGDKRVPGVIEQCLHRIDYHIGRRPLFNWGKFRWFEALIAVYWLYEQKQESWLLDLAIKLHAQGFNWLDFFRRWPLTEPTAKGNWNYMGHVVNNAMAIKSPALWWRLTGEKEDQKMAFDMIERLDRYHGMVTGVFSGDECLAGKNPSHGTELCAVVEYMYSLEVLLAILGEPEFADRLEKIAYNALPATFSPDMWAHQYDQQVNQVECSIKENRIWNTNGPESNIFGLEPNYGCCTSNFSQGWPKLASHLWMKTDANGLAALVYAPCTITTEIKNVPVTVEVVTDYPFRDNIVVKISSEKSVNFPLQLRIPAWAEEATVLLNGEEQKKPKVGRLYRIKRRWRGTSEIVLTFPMKARASQRYNQAIAIERGPLVYSLKIGERWEQVNEDKPFRELPHGDWEVYATSPWNYALDLDEKKIMELEFKEHHLGAKPFSPAGAPISAVVNGLRIHSWILESGSASTLPQSPVRADGTREDIVLIPYGCTNLRVTEFPILR